MNLPENYKYIGAFLTMRCNLNCEFCLNKMEQSTFKKLRTKIVGGLERELTGEEWVSALNEWKTRDVPITFSGGEPTLHRDFIYILNHLKKETQIHLLTNLNWGTKFTNKFLDNVDPDRFKLLMKHLLPFPDTETGTDIIWEYVDSNKYAPIRVSYHPSQMGDGKELVERASLLKQNGFNLCIYSVLYPSNEQLTAINQMQYRCKDADLDFRVKEFVGQYKGDVYGNYSKYPDASFQNNRQHKMCKTSELLIRPDGSVYRCHRDLYAMQYRIGNIANPNDIPLDTFLPCSNYGECHPCDVKVKTNYKQQLGHTSVEIKNGKLD